VTLTEKVLKLPDKQIQDVYDTLLDACCEIENKNKAWREVFKDVHPSFSIKKRNIYTLMYYASLDELDQLITGLTAK
jgi:hypothetical protein